MILQFDGHHGGTILYSWVTMIIVSREVMRIEMMTININITIKMITITITIPMNTNISVSIRMICTQVTDNG